jgi:putative tricarboxylic transport membrane protein
MTQQTDTGRQLLWSRRDMIAGGIFLIIAVVFAWEATSYDMGRLIRMGPGFIPLVLAIMLGALAIGVMLVRSDPDAHEIGRPIPWRGIALVSFALILFGAYGRVLGLVPVVFLATLVTALASRRNSIFAAIGIAVALSALCYVIFKLGLGVVLPTIGPVFGPFEIP